MTSAAEALAAAGALGPFFAVETVPVAPSPGWDRYPALLADPGALRRRVGTTRALLAAAPGRALRDVEDRVAASLTSLGLAARLASPPLGAALLTGQFPVVPPGAWLVGPPGPGPIGMAARAEGGLPWTTPADVARHLVRYSLEPVVLSVLEAFGTGFGVPARVLAGNAASAVAGAVQMIAAQRPELAGPAAEILAVLLAEGSLAGAGTWAPAERRPFTRCSCCLLYRVVDGPPPCGDCLVHRAPARRRAAAAGGGVGGAAAQR
jgi:hypothetical protein